MHTSIVVPIDDSEFGRQALPLALALARRSGADVHLVHVREPVVLPQGGPMFDTRLDDDLWEETRAELTALTAWHARDSSLLVEANFFTGPVVPTLQQFLATNRHDLVVMMTHARGEISRAWLGNVADGIVRHTSIPLLLMRPGTETPSGLAEPLFRHILVPLDGSAMAEEVLDRVVTLGTPDMTTYTLLTIVASDMLTDAAEIELECAARRAHLAGIAAELEASESVVKTLVLVHERPASGILHVADEERVDLIALTTHGRGFVSRLLLGSVADEVVRGARVPVLVYRPEDARHESAAHERGDLAALL